MYSHRPITGRNPRRRALSQYLAIGFAYLFCTWLATAANPERPFAKLAPGGVIVLDNCDPEFKDRAAYEDNLTSIDAQGKLVFRVAGLNNCESIGSNHMIATDAARGWIWIAENVGHNLRKFDRTGKELVIVRGTEASALAVDPDTGNLWALTSKGTIYGDKTVVFDSSGKQLATYDVSGYDISYDAKDKAFWIAGKNIAKISASKGEIFFQKQITTWCASSIAVHPGTGKVWIAVRRHPQVANSINELLIFDNDGALKHQVPLGDAIPFRVSVEARTGAGWVTNMRRGVQRYAPDGKLEFEHPVEALAAHGTEQGDVWVATPDATFLLSGRGELLQSIRHKSRTSQAWIAGW